MGWVEVITLLVQNAPAAIQTVKAFTEWASETWEGAQAALNKPAEEITADELLAHIAQIRAQSDEIQRL